MDNFWTLFKESIIMQGLLTLGLWGAVIYLIVAGQPVPDLLAMGATSVLGFWFGTKVQAGIEASKRTNGSG